VVTTAYWKVCRILDVADPGCFEFELTTGDKMITGFVVRWQGHWYGYENRCPHTGASLNWMPHQFFDAGLEHLVCGLHGALFQPQDGACIYGPCVGQALSPVPVLVREGDVFVDCSRLVAT